MKKLETSDQIMNDLGFCKSQFISLVLIILTGITDGTLTQCASMPLNSIATEFSQFSTFLTKDNLISILVSNFYCGIMIGSFCAGIFADTFGRKKVFLYSTLGILISQLISIMLPNSCPLILIGLQLFVGIFNGIKTTISFFYFIESISSKFKDKLMAFAVLYYILGELYGILSSYLTTSENYLNWRQYYSLSLLPITLCFIWIITLVTETIPFLIQKNKIEEAYKQFEQIINSESSDPKKYQLEQIKPKIIENWKELYLLPTEKNSKNIKIFTPEVVKLTVLMIPVWFIINFVFFGTLHILSRNIEKISYSGMVISSLSSVPTVFLTTTMVAIPALRWKNSLILSWFIIIIANIVIYILKDSILFSSLISTNRLFQSLAYSLIYGLTAEVYPNYAKTSGISICIGMGKFGSILMPWILQMVARSSNSYACYAVFAGMSAFGLMAVLSIKQKKQHQE